MKKPKSLLRGKLWRKFSKGRLWNEAAMTRSFSWKRWIVRQKSFTNAAESFLISMRKRMLGKAVKTSSRVGIATPWPR